MPSLYDKVQESAGFIAAKSSIKPEYVIVLGTGLGSLTNEISEQIVIPYDQIPHLPVSTVQSHGSQLVIGYLAGIPVLVMSGRFHYYEGYSAAELTFPIRVFRALGVCEIILTNAAGGINPHYNEGDIVIISDHINMMPDHPLRGENDERIGPRFPDMMHAYDHRKIQIFKKLAQSINITLKEGVYLGLQGPSLETPAEYKMAHILGADVVGMSTIPEVIVARHCGMSATVFSIVANVCFPKSVLTETTVEEVIAVVNHSAGKLQRLILKYFENLTD